MTLNRKAFEVAWRLAILSLPWQTRLFFDASLAGWPWEQGRISIYLSWLPLLVVVILGLFQPKRALPLALRRNLFWLIVALGACSVVAAPSPATAAMQWWIQMMLLAAFCITLLRTQVQINKIALWFVISLVPHAILAVAQFMTQTVWASKWLGMAAQFPGNLGVSVVQTATGRFLRAYGGFPHPNILGGWMAVGLVISVWLLSLTSVGERACPVFFTGSRIYIRGIEGLFTLALFYSFSRSAWVAATIGLALFVFLSFRAKSRNLDRNLKPDPSISSDSTQDDKRKSQLLTFAIPVILFAVLTIIHHDLVFTRLDAGASRLERKSVVTRLQTLRDGVYLFKAAPLFGTGPNSELPALASLKKQWIEEDSIRITALGQFPGHPNSWNAEAYVRSRMAAIGPLEPPHMVWLLILVNFGTVGALFIFGFGLFILRQIFEKWSSFSQHDGSLFIPLLSVSLIVGFLDHYSWSLWSGQALSAIILFLVLHILDNHQIDEIGA
jgi:O-antigen ligase